MALVLLLPIGAVAGAMLMNNVTLWRYQHALANAPLPPGTRVISRSADLGLLEGNGNHCDMRVAQVVATPLTAPQLDQWLAAARFTEQLDGVRPQRARFYVRPAPNAPNGQLVVEVFSPGGFLEGAEWFDIRCQ